MEGIQRVGGSFAPPITDELIDKWQGLQEDIGGITGQAITQLYDLVVAHRDCPRNTMGGTPHVTGMVTVFPLSKKAKDECGHLIPTRDELRVMSQLFEGLTGEVRDMAFHLLWYATELQLGREPITSDFVTPSDDE